MTTPKNRDQRNDSGNKKEEKEKGEIEEKIEISQQEFGDLKARADSAAEYRDKMLRALAEVDNSRKRLEKEKGEFLEFANQELINDLIPVLDNFERALLSAPASKSPDPYRQGVEMIYKQLKETLEKQGLEEIKAVGEKFDPFFHEAVEQEVSKDHPEGTISGELLKGYLLKGKLIRPAAVRVSQAPAGGSSAKKKPEELSPEEVGKSES